MVQANTYERESSLHVTESQFNNPSPESPQKASTPPSQTQAYENKSVELDEPPKIIVSTEDETTQRLSTSSSSGSKDLKAEVQKLDDDAEDSLSPSSDPKVDEDGKGADEGSGESGCLQKSEKTDSCSNLLDDKLSTAESGDQAYTQDVEKGESEV